MDGTFAAGLVDGKSICTFARVKTVPEGTPEGDLVLDLGSNREHYFLLANGPLDSNGKLQQIITVRNLHLQVKYWTPLPPQISPIRSIFDCFLRGIYCS